MPLTPDIQLSKLLTLLAALRHNPFYAAKLGPAIEARSLQDFFTLAPFTTKRELLDDQHEHPPFGTNHSLPLELYVRFCQTSATTGKPMRWLDTRESWDWMKSCWIRVFEAAGVTREDRVFVAFSFGPFLGFWLAFDAAEQIGCLCIPGGGLRSAARLAIIMDMQATVVCCTPTYAIRLGEVAREEGIDLSQSKVRTIVAAGEPGASLPATQKVVRELWNGARLFDHHGMTEVGPVSYGCPLQPDVLHVIEAEFIAEILDPASLQPVAAGETGELILTGLGRLGSPVVRYRTNDLVRRGPAGPCVCGTTDLSLPGGILGRIDDMLVIRGVNVYPSAVDEVMRAAGGVAEYRVEVRNTRGLFDLHVVAEPDLDHAADGLLAHRIETALNNAFALRIGVSVTAPGALPRFEMKAKRWLRV